MESPPAYRSCITTSRIAAGGISLLSWSKKLNFERAAKTAFFLSRKGFHTTKVRKSNAIRGAMVIRFGALESSKLSAR